MKTSRRGFRVIGTRPVRHDGLDKVTGRAMYGADVRLPGQVWAEVVRSPHAHARIRSIDPSDALAMRGVLGVVTAADFPCLEEYGDMPGNAALVDQAENVMARDKVLYRGHAVAAVAAVDRNTAIEAAKRVKVEYEPLKPVMSIEDAMAPDAPVLHPGRQFAHLGKTVEETNVASHFRFEVGEPDMGFASAELVVERTARLNMVHQGYIEPHNALARWDEDGHITVWSSTQGMFGIRDQLAKLLCVPESHITVNSVEIGGGFGGKTTVYLPPVAAVLSRKTGRPVKMVMDRKDVFQATGPAPGAVVTVRMGVDERQRITAAETDIWMEAGAFPGSAVELATAWCFTPYDISNLRADGYDVLVNKPKSHAYRAPGLPQAAFCVEQVIDEICEIKGWDPIAFRQANAAHEGSRRTDGIALGRVGFAEVLEAAKRCDHWKSGWPTSDGKALRGRGIAVGYCPHIGGRSSVRMSVNHDGTVSLSEGSQDIGGTRAALAMIAAEVLGLSAESVRPSIPGTDDIGYTDTTDGSRVVNATGHAVWMAANNLLDELKCRAAIILGVDQGSIAFAQGAFSSSDTAAALTFAELSSRLDETGGPVEVVGHADLTEPTNGFAAHICDVEVDVETGKTQVTRYTAVQDVGTAVHPSYVEGQMQGGAVQGIGWALNEEYVFDPEGRMENPSFLDYRMPIALDLPMIETVIVEVPNPLHPVGARGVAETPIVSPMAAVANAIHDATKRRFYEQPMNPAKIIRALAEKRRA